MGHGSLQQKQKCPGLIAALNFGIFPFRGSCKEDGTENAFVVFSDEGKQ
jgi:hypothetical protein